ncbi:MAG: hypothetical protein OXC60_18935 [Litoreibacter sp.]|nr:hypothetical protein [Litoreibacter sp.]
MTKRDESPELELDALFAEAKAARPVVDERLTVRIIEDAAVVQPAPVVVARPSQGPLARLLELLGGWPAVGGLVTAAATGIYIGFAQPSLLTGVEEAVTDPSFTTSSFLPGDDMFFEEG